MEGKPEKICSVRGFTAHDPIGDVRVTLKEPHITNTQYLRALRLEAFLQIGIGGRVASYQHARGVTSLRHPSSTKDRTELGA